MTSNNINFSHLALTPKQILSAAPFIGDSNTPTNNVSVPNSDFTSSTLTLDPRDIASRTDLASFGNQSTIFNSTHAPTAQQIADSTEDLVVQILSSTINTRVGSHPTGINDFLDGITPRLGVPYSSLFGEDPPSSLGILVDTDIIGRAIVGQKSVFIEDKTFLNDQLAPFVAYNDDLLQSLVTQVPTAGMRNLLDPETFSASLASSGLFSAQSLGSVSGQQKISDLITALGTVPSDSLVNQVYPNGIPGNSSLSGLYGLGLQGSTSNTSTSLAAYNALFQQQASATQSKLLKQAMQLFGNELPDVIPNQTPGGALQFILDFMALSESDRDKVRSTLNVETALNEDALTDIDSTTGGDYDLGLAVDPFNRGLVQSAGNPLLSLIADGWLVPNGFQNGVVQSDSQAADQIFGLTGHSNAIDGQGHQDRVYLGSQDDFAKAYAGDILFARDGDDSIYHTVGVPGNHGLGFVDGGAGDDRFVIAMNNPGNSSYHLTPLISQLGNLVHVLLSNGQQFLTRAIESIVITDTNGHVFKRHTITDDDTSTGGA